MRVNWLRSVNHVLLESRLTSLTIRTGVASVRKQLISCGIIISTSIVIAEVNGIRTRHCMIRICGLGESSLSKPLQIHLADPAQAASSMSSSLCAHSLRANDRQDERTCRKYPLGCGRSRNERHDRGTRRDRLVSNSDGAKSRPSFPRYVVECR